MEPIELTAEDDTSSEAGYITFENAEFLDSFQQLRREVREEALARQFQSEASENCCHPSCSRLKCVKVFFLTAVVCLIWLALTVPSIYYIVIVVSSYTVLGPSPKSVATGLQFVFQGFGTARYIRYNSYIARAACMEGSI